MARGGAEHCVPGDPAVVLGNARVLSGCRPPPPSDPWPRLDPPGLPRQCLEQWLDRRTGLNPRSARFAGYGVAAPRGGRGAGGGWGSRDEVGFGGSEW